MAITIKGIRVDFVSFERGEDGDRLEIKNAQYSLISSTDHVLAKQSIGGYGSMALKPSVKTLKLQEEFMQSYKEDVQSAVGLDLE